MSRLIVYGDSYSTPGFCVDPQDSWWGLLATELGVDTVENYSWPGNNIDSIGHIIVSDPAQYRPGDYVVVGVPPIERLTVFEDDARPKQYVVYDSELTEHTRKEVVCHSGLRQLTRHQLGRQDVDLWNRSWQEAQVLRQLITLLSYLESKVKNTLILNLAEPFQPRTNWATLTGLQQQAYNDLRIIIDRDTYYSVNYQVNQPMDFETHGWFGHQGPVGNRHWFSTVIHPHIKALGWCK